MYESLELLIENSVFGGHKFLLPPKTLVAKRNVRGEVFNSYYKINVSLEIVFIYLSTN